MKKLTKMVVVVLITILAMTNVSWAEEPAAEELHMYDNSPGFVWNNTALIPADKAFEFLGLDYNYDESDGIIWVDNIDAYSQMAMQVNNKFATFGISEVYMNVPPVVYNGAVYIPCKNLIEWVEGVSEFDSDSIYLSVSGSESTIKSAVFPVVEADLSKLTRIPQVSLIEPVTAGDIPVKGDLDSTIRLKIAAGQYPTEADWVTLSERAYTVLNKMRSNSDIAMTLTQQSNKSFLHIFVPMMSVDASGLNPNMRNYSYYYEQRASTIASTYLKNIAYTTYLTYLNDELRPGLWEKYSTCIKVSMVNSVGSQITVEAPLTAKKIGDYVLHTFGGSYKVYINNNLLKYSTSQCTDKYDSQLVEFFRHPVTKPVQPYFDMIDYKYNKSLMPEYN